MIVDLVAEGTFRCDRDDLGATPLHPVDGADLLRLTGPPKRQGCGIGRRRGPQDGAEAAQDGPGRARAASERVLAAPIRLSSAPRRRPRSRG